MQGGRSLDLNYIVENSSIRHVLTEDNKSSFLDILLEKITNRPGTRKYLAQYKQLCESTNSTHFLSDGRSFLHVINNCYITAIYISSYNIVPENLNHHITLFFSNFSVRNYAYPYTTQKNMVPITNMINIKDALFCNIFNTAIFSCDEKTDKDNLEIIDYCISIDHFEMLQELIGCYPEHIENVIFKRFEKLQSESHTYWALIASKYHQVLSDQPYFMSNMTTVEKMARYFPTVEKYQKMINYGPLAKAICIMPLTRRIIYLGLNPIKENISDSLSFWYLDKLNSLGLKEYLEQVIYPLNKASIKGTPETDTLGYEFWKYNQLHILSINNGKETYLFSGPEFQRLISHRKNFYTNEIIFPETVSEIKHRSRITNMNIIPFSTVEEMLRELVP